MTKEIITLTSSLIETDETLKITIEGDSEMPFWNHDLKVKAAISLINSIDVKHYYEDNKVTEADESYRKIIESTKLAFGYDLEED